MLVLAVDAGGAGQRRHNQTIILTAIIVHLLLAVELISSASRLRLRLRITIDMVVTGSHRHLLCIVNIGAHYLWVFRKPHVVPLTVSGL